MIRSDFAMALLYCLLVVLLIRGAGDRGRSRSVAPARRPTCDWTSRPRPGRPRDSHGRDLGLLDLLAVVSVTMSPKRVFG